jgi:hypothetical protein
LAHFICTAVQQEIWVDGPNERNKIRNGWDGRIEIADAAADKPPENNMVRQTLFDHNQSRT